MAAAVQTRTRAASARKLSEPAHAGEVARVAYELFERRGRVDGYDQDDWLEAERLVKQRRRRA